MNRKGIPSHPPHLKRVGVLLALAVAGSLFGFQATTMNEVAVADEITTDGIEQGQVEPVLQDFRSPRCEVNIEVEASVASVKPGESIHFDGQLTYFGKEDIDLRVRFDSLSGSGGFFPGCRLMLRRERLTAMCPYLLMQNQENMFSPGPIAAILHSPT